MSYLEDLIVVGDDLDPHYSATVLADSVSPEGVRLTTFKLVYPRFVHSEMMTHRDKSRNAASSRAIPTEKLIEQVRTDPFVPATFNQRVAGMGVGEEFDADKAKFASKRWRWAAEDAARNAEALMKLGLDKSRANRLLEPFLWYTAIFSGTEWDNMLALRDHPAAQQEIQAIARCMRKGFAESTPQQLDYGMWHLPMTTADELAYICDLRQNGPGDNLAFELENLKMISASRCARVSFDRYDDEPYEATIKRAEMLMGNGHFSPFEHVARPIDPDNDLGKYGYMSELYPGDDHFAGNFRGWIQMRKEIPNESRFDLVIEKQSA